MFGIIVFTIAFLLGFPIAHYSSYLINNCEDCVKPITFKVLSVYTLVACLLSGALWLGIYIALGITMLSVIYMIVASILLSISIVDFAVYEIPPQYDIAIAILGVVCLIADYRHWYLYLIGACTVSGIFLLIFFASKGEGMGFGDIKLMAAAGLLLGWKKILFVMVIGSILGILFHGAAMLILRKKHVLSFGPYLAMGTYIMMLYGDAIVGWYINTFFNFTY